MENGKWKMENEQTRGWRVWWFEWTSHWPRKRRSATARIGGEGPGLESPGYLQASLCDGSAANFCAEREGTPLQCEQEVLGWV
jgi:hypothetical protein